MIAQINENGLVAVKEQREELKEIFMQYATKEVEIIIQELGENETVNTIERIVNWYSKLKQDFNDIDILINERRYLSVAFYDFGKVVSDAFTSFTQLETERKMGVEKRKKEILDTQLKNGEKPNISKALTIAEYEFTHLREIESAYESTYKRLHLHYNSTSKVLDSMNQHISHLKNEKANISHTVN